MLHHLLFHFPHTPRHPLREHFAFFPWVCNRENLRAWQRGSTGYPIVDAGMRELWNTGWMHNRVRMIVASFLVKDLLIDWQEARRGFGIHSSTRIWQTTPWVGSGPRVVRGCRAYFRIFNPVRQGEEFDPHGDYVRRWVPELGYASSEWIHKPWEAAAGLLADAGIELGITYPRPIVDHREARVRALKALEQSRTWAAQPRLT